MAEQEGRIGREGWEERIGERRIGGKEERIAEKMKKKGKGQVREEGEMRGTKVTEEDGERDVMKERFKIHIGPCTFRDVYC